MKKIKVVLCGSKIDQDGPGTRVIRENMTDWEEVSEEDYELLSKNLRKIKTIDPFKSAVIVCQDLVPASQRVSDVKKLIASAQEKVKKKNIDKELKKRAKLKQAEEVLKVKLAELQRLTKTLEVPK